ncbi:MAG: hypothetical protein ACTSVI_02920 [Promethearchaeota archaeon]
MSVETYDIMLEFVDLGKVNGLLERASAPLTIQTIYKKLLEKFISGRVRWIDFTKKDAFYFDINIQKGKEGQPAELKKNELGYIYKLDSVVVALEDDPEIPYFVVKIGRIIDEPDIFKNLRNGLSVKMKLRK